MSEYDFFEETRDDGLRYELRAGGLAPWRPQRFTVHCPACGRGMRSDVYLARPHWRSTGLKTCATCREHERLNLRTEEKRRAVR